MKKRPIIEEKYYGSPLNKFIAERCKKKMTVINIDLITYDRKLRIIQQQREEALAAYEDL